VELTRTAALGNVIEILLLVDALSGAQERRSGSI
jgi:hypothetical protein